jgi:CRISPR system Cascade subunit CasD
MATLLLRLAAPLQAWGAESKFEQRRTLRFPTKSGVTGLLAAALGLSREEPLDRLNALRFGVRCDREGDLLPDYHTAHHPQVEKMAYITVRHYLSDAVFLAGFESDDAAFLQELEEALRHPVYPLFLGRRSCPPTMPLVLGIREKSLLEALRQEPRLCEKRRDESGEMFIYFEDANGEARLRDIPLSFSQTRRKYDWRRVSQEKCLSLDTYDTEQDLFAEL